MDHFFKNLCLCQVGCNGNGQVVLGKWATFTYMDWDDVHQLANIWSCSLKEDCLQMLANGGTKATHLFERTARNPIVLALVLLRSFLTAASNKLSWKEIKLMVAVLYGSSRKRKNGAIPMRSTEDWLALFWQDFNHPPREVSNGIHCIYKGAYTNSNLKKFLAYMKKYLQFCFIFYGFWLLKHWLMPK